MRNDQKGTVPCPVPACGETCRVYQFADRSSAPQHRRKAGKFYIDCAEHGRLGFDGSAWIQEHVLAHITWSNDEAKKAASAPAPAASAQAGARPAPKQPALPALQTQTRGDVRNWWELL